MAVLSWGISGERPAGIPPFLGVLADDELGVAGREGMLISTPNWGVLLVLRGRLGGDFGWTEEPEPEPEPELNSLLWDGIELAIGLFMTFVLSDREDGLILVEVSGVPWMKEATRGPPAAVVSVLVRFFLASLPKSMDKSSNFSLSSSELSMWRRLWDW